MATFQARIVEAVLDPRLASARRRVADAAATLRRAQPKLTLYYQAGDAYSHLCARLLMRARQRLALEPRVVVVPRVADATNAAPDLWPDYGVQDAKRIAPAWGLVFDPLARAPSEPTRELAERVLLATTSLDEFLQIESEVGAALWRDTTQPLKQRPMLGPDQARSRLNRNYRELLSKGHYQGGMWLFRGDWYWGLDRMAYLETRLRRLGLVRGNEPLVRRDPAAARLPDLTNTGTLRFFYSFRSPYSHIAAERIDELGARYPVNIAIRPVLPMVMRGLQVPRSKRLYIARDAKREATRHGIGFGRIADPLGGGVERCLAVFPLARQAGRELAFIREAGRAVWHRGEPIRRDRVLREVLARAGLDPGLAARAPRDGGDLEYAESNRKALGELGLWGVPSYQLGELAVWGQDRQWLIEEALRRLHDRPIDG